MSLWNLSLLLLLLFDTSQAFPQCGNQVKISGRYICNGVGVPFIRLYFVHTVGFMENFLGNGVTDEDGYFQIIGAPIILPKGTPSTLRIGTTYQFEDTQKGYTRQLRVLYGDTEEFPMIEGGNIDLGDIQGVNYRCAAYQTFYGAVRDYIRRAGGPLEIRINVHVDEEVLGAPFTDYDNVLSKKDFEWNMETARHELAHVVRHGFDGDFEHFEKVRDKYKCDECQDHDCDTETNEGFAFNEGWAMYWAGQCMGHLHNPTARFDIAGDVAAALRNLNSSCGAGDGDMVRTLKMYPGSIHSYTQFETKHKREFSCP